MPPAKRNPIGSAAADSEPPPPSSAIEIAENPDLLNEILLRLPIKSLLKFKSVSTNWLSLISDPTFTRLRRTGPASGLFLERFDADDYDFVDLTPSETPPRPPFRSLAFGDVQSGVGIVQSCNGLLLCCSDIDSRDESRRNFFVYNPTTKHHARLPPPPPRISTSPTGSPRTIRGISLAFDLSRSPHYKAICARNSSGDPSQFWIEIYSSGGAGAGQWRPSSLGHFTAGFDTLFDRGVFWSGSVHWISPWSTSLRFDVEAEMISEMPMPPVTEALVGLDRSFGYFGESGDRLHFVDHLLIPGETLLKVYEMERDYSGWFVKFVVDLSPVAAVFPEMILGPDSESDSDEEGVALPVEYQMCVLCVVRCEVEEESFLVVNIPGKVLRYEFESGSFSKLCDIQIVEGPDLVLESSEAFQYIESLASV